MVAMLTFPLGIAPLETSPDALSKLLKWRYLVTQYTRYGPHEKLPSAPCFVIRFDVSLYTSPEEKGSTSLFPATAKGTW